MKYTCLCTQRQGDLNEKIQQENRAAQTAAAATAKSLIVLSLNREEERFKINHLRAYFKKQN